MMSHLLTKYQSLLVHGPVDVISFLSSSADSSWEMQLEVVLHDQSIRWKSGDPSTAEEYLAGLPQLAKIPQAVIAIAIAEYSARYKTDSKPNLKEYTERFPDIEEQLRAKVSELESAALAPSSLKTQRFSPDFDQEVLLCNRYRLIRALGKGSFGTVYLALDLELKRQVAVKVPNPERFVHPHETELYLEEARTVACLEHPNIVPVYDMGRTLEGAVFIVSRYVEGETLESRMRLPMSFEEATKILKIVAEALQYAHDRRLIHRDIKPANILLETLTNTPFLTDFGLAIREDDYAKQLGLAGTVAFMSPEQARGEGHRLDGRSDIFALGVILYEMLTGDRPFAGSTQNEILHKIISVEPRSPRLIRSEVPLELERICLKALSKQLSGRYSNSAMLADDLMAWQQPATSTKETTAKTQIVPRGLRSFDASCAFFFLDLLPGPRNRDGLPESIAFWKKRIEETDRDQTFSVGLIYGPSGCGKSSLVKAGLIPNLSKDVSCIYIEATAEDTETRILRGLSKELPELPNSRGLVDTVALIRRESSKKIVIIIDQFEQWLHAHRAEPDSELVRALRQCDGGRLQAIIMVRDDFSVAAARLMNTLDIPMVQGHNFALIDLFDTDHAESVLKQFGQAFGKLPPNLADISTKEEQFVHEVVEAISENGKVVSVRLSLLSEMVKGKAWERATLGKIGGVKGIGVSFLEEAFGSTLGNPSHRLHAVAARGVLRALLPELGTDIKGHMRSQAELLEASGYGSRPNEFKELLRILDGELRLITPTDPEGHGSQSRGDIASSQFFQLTHDYLVPSLRDWLTTKQRETSKGRAELKLAERASVWESTRETKQLPTMFEWLSIRALTESKKWSDSQKAMMKKTDRMFGTRICVGSVVACGIIAIGLVLQSRITEQQNVTEVQGWVQALITAEPDQLLDVIQKLNSNSRLSRPELLKFASNSPTTQKENRAQLHTRLALVSRDPTLVPPLLEEALTNDIRYLGTIREQLRPYRERVAANLKVILNDNSEEKGHSDRRFRAALLLAGLLPSEDHTAWTEQNLSFVARQLVASNTERQPFLRQHLRPIQESLLPELESIFGDSKYDDARRMSAANAFADYAKENTLTLARLLEVATPDQYSMLFPFLASTANAGVIENYSKIAATLPSSELGALERLQFGKRRANVAVTLLRLGEYESAFQVFGLTDDPEALTQFVFRCRDLGVRVEELLELLRLVSNAPPKSYPSNTLYALLLSLGEYSLKEVSESHREALLTQLGDWYRNDPSSGVHGAVGWLLRAWGQHEIARQVDRSEIPYADNREWFTLAIGSPSLLGSLFGSRNNQIHYHTFVVVTPGDYEIGPLDGEIPEDIDGFRSRVRITRPFAILDREVTRHEFGSSEISNSGISDKTLGNFASTPDHPMVAVSWYAGVLYCRWLTNIAGFSSSDQAYPDPWSLSKKVEEQYGNPGLPQVLPIDLGKRGFRLPTEAEWEIAARGGMNSQFSFGRDQSLLNRFAWFQDNSNGKTHVAKTLRPNLRGLFDTHGTVFEWCHDSYANLSKNKIVLVDPIGNEKGEFRVYRGGSWQSFGLKCSTAERGSTRPDTNHATLGFRVVFSILQASE